MNGITTLLLDGIWGRPRRFAKMRRALEASCGPTEIFRYDCSGVGSIETEGRKLASVIRDRTEPVNVIGFSMGGLVIRAAHLADPGVSIRRAAFLNVPHSGTWMANLVPLKIMQGIRQMQPSSDFLRRLTAAVWKIPTLAVWCPYDLLVMPGSSANWSTATERIRCGVPLHSWPVFSKSMHARITGFFNLD